eukprot:767836-Hanusia_phi.AAC.4
MGRRVSLLALIVSLALPSAASRPRGETLVQPEVWQDFRSACPIRSCTRTLVRKGKKLTTDLNMTVLRRNYGPLEVNVRSYNGNIPGPTLSFEAGPAPTLPTILSMTLRNELEETRSSTTVKNKVNVRDSFGLIEKTITVQRVPMDVAACVYVDVGTGANLETMFVQKIASTGSFDVEREALGSTAKVHEVGAQVVTRNMSLCDFPKQINHSNFYVYGMANVTAEHVGLLAAAQGNLTTDFFFDFAHPRGTFLYHPMWMGSSGLQTGGGMAGMVVVRDSVGEAETAFLNLREVHLLFQQLTYRNPSESDANRFYDHGYLQVGVEAAW